MSAEYNPTGERSEGLLDAVKLFAQQTGLIAVQKRLSVGQQPLRQYNALNTPMLSAQSSADGV